WSSGRSVRAQARGAQERGIQHPPPYSHPYVLTLLRSPPRPLIFPAFPLILRPCRPPTMRPYSLALVLLLVAAPAAAQDRAATERRLESLRNQIQGVEEQVQQARS